MTEDEAKTKWCPFAKPGQVRPEDCGEIRGNRMMNGDVDTGALCIGSACMAWRRGADIVSPPSVTELADHVKQHGVSPMTATAVLSKKIATGFCGLAGTQ